MLMGQSSGALDVHQVAVLHAHTASWCMSNLTAGCGCMHLARYVLPCVRGCMQPRADLPHANMPCPMCCCTWSGNRGDPREMSDEELDELTQPQVSL